MKVLEDAKVPYAITGALAAGCYGVPRATKDVDLFIPRGKKVKKLIACAKSAGFVLPREAVGIIRSGGILTLELRGEEFKVDLIVRENVTDIIARSRTLRLYGKEMRVVSPEDLIVIKLAAWSLQDRPDAIRILANQWGRLDMKRLRKSATEWSVKAELEKVLKAVEMAKRG